MSSNNFAESELRNLFEFEAASTKTSHEIMDKKSTLRALTLKRDKLAMEIGHCVKDTIPSYPFWTMDQINFDDPRLADMKDKFSDVETKISNLSWEVDRLEAIQKGELPRHEARVKAYNFLGKLTDKQATNFLKRYQLTTVSLTEACLIDPTLVDDPIDFDEKLEIIRANPEVWW
ncbi:hypothetical protein [uncultured Methanobrevibacter sp.]|uniref:hypothetical protein n=1 Tax=uncultured Methanobrevibacter sp. TaxID=253161 RepID=UPI0025F2CDF2|nr:hypothetical protein [uncultured Methanobrevibacter sp.]